MADGGGQFADDGETNQIDGSPGGNRKVPPSSLMKGLANM
jgi:hypothetical protein